MTSHHDPLVVRRRVVLGGALALRIEGNGPTALAHQPSALCAAGTAIRMSCADAPKTYAERRADLFANIPTRRRFRGFGPDLAPRRPRWPPPVVPAPGTWFVRFRRVWDETDETFSRQIKSLHLWLSRTRPLSWHVPTVPDEPLSRCRAPPTRAGGRAPGPTAPCGVRVAHGPPPRRRSAACSWILAALGCC